MAIKPKKLSRTAIRYQKDEAFAEEHRKAVRESYRKRTNIDPRYIPSDLELQEYGEDRVLEDGKMARTFTAEETAAALGYASQVHVFRWIADEQLPEMIYKAEQEMRNGRGTWVGSVKVYLLEEVIAMATVLRRHFKTYTYYTRKHTDTRYRMFSAVTKARRQDP